MERISWDRYFMEQCDAVSHRSPCKSRQIGAIAVREGHYPVATGYNGPASGFPHCSGDICPRKVRGYGSGEGLEICPAQHAERNVICAAARLGHSLLGCIMYINTNQVCRECAKAIVNAGITEVVLTGNIPYPESGISGMEILELCGVRVRIFR